MKLVAICQVQQLRGEAVIIKCFSFHPKDTFCVATSVNHFEPGVTPDILVSI